MVPAKKKERPGEREKRREGEGHRLFELCRDGGGYIVRFGNIVFLQKQSSHSAYNITLPSLSISL